MHEDRVQDRVDVVRPEVRDPHHHDVGLAAHLDQLLAVQVLERPLVHRFHLARVDAGDLVRRLDAPEELPAHARRREVVPLLRGHHQGLVLHGPLPFPLVEEPQLRREGLAVQRGLDLEHLHAVGGEEAPHPDGRVVDRRVSGPRIHVALRLEHRVHVVVVPKALVAGQADRDRLVAAVHRHEVDVHVDDQVGLRRPLHDLDVLAHVGLTDVGEPVLVLCVEVVQAIGPEGAVDALADHPADLLGRHPAVQRRRHDDLEVLHPGAGGQLDHVLEHALTHVRGHHRRQRDREVVDRDRELHPREQQLGQRLLIAGRLEQRATDLPVEVAQARQRIRRIHDARAEREPLHPVPLALVDDQGRRPLVHLQHEPWSGHLSAALLIPAARTPP